MSARTLLKSLLVYQAWANDELLGKLVGMDPSRNAKERHAALRLMNHIHVVSRIFAAHLTGIAHGYASDNTEETPEPAELRAAMAESDRWYLDYAETVSEQWLAEPLAFTFTDGDRGRMTRQEMLTPSSCTAAIIVARSAACLPPSRSRRPGTPMPSICTGPNRRVACGRSPSRLRQAPRCEQETHFPVDKLCRRSRSVLLRPGL